MKIIKLYHSYIQNAKYSPSGRELINVAIVFYNLSDKQAAVYIHHALTHGEIKKNPALPGHYTI
ncbi:MAG: hypothetical protein K2O91_00135 [Lachnospiraceae bacterium]|nr:hypothetical protein [Lachnospiraceae bacterium]